MERVQLGLRTIKIMSTCSEIASTDGVEIRSTGGEPQLGMGPFSNLNSRREDTGDFSQGQGIVDGLPPRKKRIVHVDLDDEKENTGRVDFLLGKLKEQATQIERMKKEVECVKEEMESVKKDFDDESKERDQKSKAIISSMQTHIEKLVAERNEVKQNADAQLLPLAREKESLQIALDATLRRLVKRKDKWTSEREQKMTLANKFTEVQHRNWKLEFDVSRLEAEAAEEQLQPAYTQFVAELELNLKFLKEEKNRLDIAQETGGRSLDEVKEGRLCQICLDSPTDTMSFPCLHFQYCFGCLELHRKRSNTCPSCRTAITSVHKSSTE